MTVPSPNTGGGTSNSVFFPIFDPTSSIALRRSDYATGSGPHWVLAVDFDRDGKVDLATANYFDNTVSISLKGFLVSTSIAIQDENGNGIEGASLQIKTILPSGSVLAFPARTDATGQATISFGTEESGLYRFKVRKVTHPTRNCDPSLNIETSDTLLIP